MIILLNGYVRRSVLSNDLYLFLKKLETIDKLEIYIHTWNVAQDDGCWKSNEIIKARVTKELIDKYFRDLSQYIKFIQIDESNNLNNKDYINTTGCSLTSWKKMLNAQKLLLDQVNNLESIIINMSFDLFLSKERDIDSAFNFIKYHYSLTEKNLYSNIFSGCTNGLDELYLGNFRTIDKLFNHFNKNLNKIINNYQEIGSPEYLLYWENNILDYSIDDLSFDEKKILILINIKTNLKSDIYKYCCDYIDNEFNFNNFNNIDNNLIKLTKKEILQWKTDSIFINDLFLKSNFDKTLFLNIEKLNKEINQKIKEKEPVQEHVEEHVEDHVEDHIKEHIVDHVEEHIQDHVEEPVESVEEHIQDHVESVEESVEDHVEDHVEEPDEEPDEESVVESVEESVEEPV